ncbi:hypothetical protein [Streptomyces sp. CS113]|uniref:hypothetical protein n=1 Tax=Streptomyces sp. CS113 TaxID=1982761 RepID=UPI00211AB581|nr:hypothetical protein [Streptomyces sp. CS113]
MGRGTAVGKTGAGASVHLSTDSVSGPEGFGWWGDMVSRAVMPVSLASAHADHFEGEVALLELVDTEFSAFSFSPMSARRTPDHIRSSDPENYYLFLVHGSPSVWSSAATTLCCAPGTWLCSTHHSPWPASSRTRAGTRG